MHSLLAGLPGVGKSDKTGTGNYIYSPKSHSLRHYVIVALMISTASFRHFLEQTTVHILYM